MQHLSVQATLRPKQSRGVMSRLRQSGQTPVSVSGKGMEPVSLYIATSEIHRILHAKAGMNTLIDIAFSGGNHVARLIGVERNPISNLILSVALQKITAGETRKATIGLTFVGEAAAVRDQNGLLSVLMDHLEVRALPEQMVASITVDISSLALGESLRAGDIELPASFELLTDKDAAIVAVRAGSLAPVPATDEAQPSAE